MNAIEVSAVSKRYGDYTMQQVSFDLPQGCVLGLVGENGAGKSTLIRMMLGACRIDSGSMTVLGRRADRSAEFARVRQDIGVVLDESCLPDEMNAKEIGLFMKQLYIRWDAAAYEGLLKRFDLPSNKPVKALSRGTRMKLAIAVAMSHKAKLLILDEATSGLDPIVRDEILNLFNDFTRDETHSILMSSHIVSDLEKICDYIVFLHNGQVMLKEEKDVLFEKYALLTLEQGALRTLAPDAVVRVMPAHGAVRALVRRDRIARDVVTDHMNIEDMMLLLTKGEKLA